MVVERVDSDLWLLITPTILDDDTRDELLEHADIGLESDSSFTSRTSTPT